MPRRFLTDPSVDRNIAEWKARVEDQTGRPFGLQGQAASAAEEVLELLVAADEEHPDASFFLDAIGGSYVASTVLAGVVMRRLVKEGVPCGGPFRGVVDPLYDERFHRFALSCVGLVRRGPEAWAEARGSEAWPMFLEETAHVRATLVHMMEEECAGGFQQVMSGVLDQMDRRLQAGYRKDAEGSAPKRG